MATGSFMTPIYSRSQGEVQRDLHNGAQRIHPENRVGSSFRIIPEQYFSGVENIDDFLENIDHNLAYYEMPAQLACAYLKGHLKGRALDWFEVLGYRVNEDKTTDYAHLKQALSEQFPVVRNRSELETRFYSSSQRRDQQPSDFIYELLKIHKVLKLEMSEENLIDHVVSRLEPQILDYVEVRHPRNTANLLQIVDKYEERFMHRQIRGSSEGFRSSGPNEGNRFNTRHRQENWRENGNNERYANNSQPQREFNRFENQGFTNNRRFEGRRQGGQSDQRFHNQGGRQCGSRNSLFQGRNERSRNLKLLSDRCEYGVNRSRGTGNPPIWDHRPIRVSSIRMTPVELPYVPILLNETFITALWDTGAEKSFISEEIYRKYFSYRPRQKTKDRVVTAQGAPCSHLGRVELQIRIREFQKPWEFHILDNMQYQCILGINFMKASRLTLEFDQKSLIIPDNLIKQRPKKDDSEDNLVALHFKYDQARRRFVEWAQNEIAVVPDFHKRILFSDEAHFWLNSYVNKQNCRIWSEANPQVYVETLLHPEKLTVCCALWAGGIIGPYFFKNDEGHNVAVNGDRYRAMITNFFIPELNNHDVEELWFQQDGATCHTARATIDLLKDTFGDRLISLFGPVNWPPRSCDLTPLDYFL
ncbi:uncharacterized protein TNCV_4613211 [Trichonephila clavipes]|nr:uncharacterized protein TNCV_4613211 [Trichonephila clavipes]